MSDVDSVLSLLFGKRRRVKKRSAKKSSFGKKKRSFGRKTAKKPAKKAKKVPLALRRKCKKCGIKLTVKRGSKRVPKSEKLLKKQLAKNEEYKLAKKLHKKSVRDASEKYKFAADVWNATINTAGIRNCMFSKTPIAVKDF